MITDWVCDNSEHFRACSRDVGYMREVVIVQDSDVNRAAIFGLPKMDLSKVDSRMVLGESTVVGWPSWFPIFNRRRVYSHRYPVKEGSNAP